MKQTGAQAAAGKHQIVFLVRKFSVGDIAVVYSQRTALIFCSINNVISNKYLVVLIVKALIVLLMV